MSSPAGPPVATNASVQQQLQAQLDLPIDSPESSSVDPLDELLANYNFICHPEGRIKLKQQIAGCALGLCIAKPWDLGTRFRLTLKPNPGEGKAPGLIGKNIQKLLLIPTHSQVALFSRKVNLGWLRLQAVVGYNYAKKRTTLDYRVATKWGDGPRLKRKERFDFASSQLRCKWNLDFHLPDMEGHIGENNIGMEAVDVDWGRLDFEISQLDLVVQSPFRLWSKKLPASSSCSTAASSSTKALPAPPGTAAMRPSAQAAAPMASNRANGRGASGNGAGTKQVAGAKGGSGSSPSDAGSGGPGAKIQELIQKIKDKINEIKAQQEQKREGRS